MFVIKELIEKFPFAKFDIQTDNFDDVYTKFVLSRKSWTIVIAGYFFKWNDISKFTISPHESDHIRSKDEWVSLLRLDKFHSKNMVLDDNENELPVSYRFYNEIISHTEYDWAAYILTESKDITLELNLCDLDKKSKHLEYWGHACIAINKWLGMNEILKLIDKLPHNIEYTFRFDNGEDRFNHLASDDCLDLLTDERIVGSIKKIRGKVVSYGWEIEAKLIEDDDELEQLRSKVRIHKKR